PQGFTTPEESATYTMLRHVLHNHLATTALSYEDALNVILELFCKLCALFYADICRAPGAVLDAQGGTMDIPGLVRHQINWLKRYCHIRQQHHAPYKSLSTDQSSFRHTHQRQRLFSLRTRCSISCRTPVTPTNSTGPRVSLSSEHCWQIFSLVYSSRHSAILSRKRIRSWRSISLLC